MADIGDRYLRNIKNGYTVERIEDHWLCVDDGGGYPHIHGWQIGAKWDFILLEKNFTYLGNFTKSNNFRIIYDILNSTELS